MTLTEVPGNPSFSVTNGMPKILPHLRERFDLPADAEVIVYEIWPKGAYGDPQSRVMRVPLLKEVSYQKATRKQIQRLLGEPLLELPPHEELHRRVLAIGGGVTEDKWRHIFVAIPVTDLPPPQLPFNCLHLERFQAMQAAGDVGESANDRSARKSLGQRFWDSLTCDDLRQCDHYHSADWRDIADQSVAVLEEVGESASGEAYSDRAATIGSLAASDRSWLISLFANPIILSDDGYTNGQHRACALRFSGADKAVVSTGDEFLGAEPADWTYEGEG
jgi:hypothetical protein